MPTIIIQADWPQELSSGISLVERVVPRQARDEAYLRQLVQRIRWALDDAERAEAEGTDAHRAEGADAEAEGTDAHRAEGADAEAEGADAEAEGADAETETHTVSRSPSELSIQLERAVAVG